MNQLYVTLLAGGMGKRMQSSLPKVLHKINGEVMIVKLLNQILALNPAKILIVVGKFREIISAEINKYLNDNRIICIDQDLPLGTGHAVQCTLEYLNHTDDEITNLILNGDVPLLRSRTIQDIYQYYLHHNSRLLITSINLTNPTGNGRIIMDENNYFKEIVEEKDCTPEQKSITLINCGIYICCRDILKQYIPKITNNNVQKEYYLTDLVKIYRDATNQIIDLFVLSPEKEIEIYNVNTKEQLQFVEKIDIKN